MVGLFTPGHGKVGDPLDAPMDVVTGAFSYTGQSIARRLLGAGRRVRTITGHPDRTGVVPGVEAFPFDFEHPDLVTDHLRGADTLYSTYWVRFARGDVDHMRAVAHLQTLFAAARSAGVRRVVHVSITGADAANPLPYFRGKGLVEQFLATSGLSFGIVRPALIFGDQDVLLHNIAWILRRFPVFTVFGDGCYRIQPVHVDDLAEIAIRLGGDLQNATVDAVGPETYSFTELVQRISRAIGRHPRILHVAPGTGLLLGRLLSLLVGDVLITKDEIAGLMADLLVSAQPPTAPTKLGEWLDSHAATLGARYASEVARHFDR